MKLQDTIGRTPMVYLSNASRKHSVNIFAKLEGNNPAGSVKDRPAFHMLKEALKNKVIQPGDTVIEATSGNTGIALSMCARLLGVNMILVMPEDATEERKKTMRAYGAELILTPAEKTIEYSRTHAIELARTNGYHLLNQFDNPDNWRAHYLSTGPEIWNDTQGKVTHFVSAMGTTGTIMGVSTFLKEKNPAIQVIGAQPAAESKIPGIRAWSPELRPKIFDPKKVDRTIDITSEEAQNGARELATMEGILAGMSSGGAFRIAQRIAGEMESGTIVFVVCDRGDRYLTSDLF